MLKPFCLRRLSGLAVLIMLATGTAWADSLVQVTSQPGQRANDSISWVQLGGDQTILPASFSANSAGGSSDTVTLAGANSMVSVVCSPIPANCSWTGGSGFTAGDSLIWTSDSGNGGNGPVTLTFSVPIVGAGALIQANMPGQFTAEIEAFNGTTSLGLFTVTSDINGDAVYIGLKDQTRANITSVVFSLTSCAATCSDVGIDTVYLNVGSPSSSTSTSTSTSTTPPPTTTTSTSISTSTRTTSSTTSTSTTTTSSMTNITSTSMTTSTTSPSTTTTTALAPTTTSTTMPPSCTPPPSGLVSWWPGDWNANDVQAGNNGTLQGSVGFVAGEVGQAFSFAGMDGGGVLIGNPSNLQLQDFTIDAWVRRTRLDIAGSHPPTFDGVIVNHGHDAYDFGLFPDGEILLSQVDESFVSSGSGLQVTDTNFHHVAVTKAGSKVVFYVDGTPGVPITYGPVFAFTKNLSLGARLDVSAPTASTSTATFAGVLDEIEIFNRALTAGEIQAIFAARSAGKCTGPRTSTTTTTSSPPTTTTPPPPITTTTRLPTTSTTSTTTLPCTSARCTLGAALMRT